MSIFSILYAAFCVLQPEKQGWVEWAKSFFPTKSYSEVKAERRDESRRAKDLTARITERAKITAGSGTFAVAYLYPLLRLSGKDHTFAFNSAIFGGTWISLYFFIDGFVSVVYKRLKVSSSTREMKELLLPVIGNQLLWPTPKSKLDALTNTDEFLQYANLYAKDERGVLDMARRELIEEISTTPYFANEALMTPQEIEAKKSDKEIDKHILQLRSSIAHLPLDQQITKLKEREYDPMSNAQKQGYLSLLYRLENKLEVEKHLTPEQKKEIHGWKFEVQEAVSNLSEQELESRKQAWQKKESEARKKIMHDKEIARLLQEKPRVWQAPPMLEEK